MKIVIKGIPPSLNQFAGKVGGWEYRKAKDMWTRIAWAAAKQAGAGREPPPQKARVYITYFFKDGRRHDPDNYCGKFLLDGLTKARAIIDDDFAHVQLILDGKCDKHYPRTEIAIEPVADTS